jgi:hypothetical protein
MKIFRRARKRPGRDEDRPGFAATIARPAGAALATVDPGSRTASRGRWAKRASEARGRDARGVGTGEGGSARTGPRSSVDRTIDVHDHAAGGAGRSRTAPGSGPRDGRRSTRCHRPQTGFLGSVRRAGNGVAAGGGYGAGAGGGQGISRSAWLTSLVSPSLRSRWGRRQIDRVAALGDFFEAAGGRCAQLRGRP